MSKYRKQTQPSKLRESEVALFTWSYIAPRCPSEIPACELHKFSGNDEPDSPKQENSSTSLLKKRKLDNQRKKLKLVPHSVAIHLERKIGSFEIQLQINDIVVPDIDNANGSLEFLSESPSSSLNFHLISKNNVPFSSNCQVMWKDIFGDSSGKQFNTDDLLVDLHSAGKLIKLIFRVCKNLVSIDVILGDIDTTLFWEFDQKPSKSSVAVAYLLRYFQGLHFTIGNIY